MMFIPAILFTLWGIYRIYGAGKSDANKRFDLALGVSWIAVGIGFFVLALA